MTKKSREYALYIAWLIALSALLVSLYFSEIQHMPVCHLCWYQRICIYPLSIILGIAAYGDDIAVKIYALPLSSLGGLFAAYQYLEQIIPNFAPIGLCGAGPSCSLIHFKLLGFITFPLLGVLACLFISLCLLLAQTPESV
jgi:disulfide bond formation protein DsbB